MTIKKKQIFKKDYKKKRIKKSKKNYLNELMIEDS
jgi:hypothetical protein